MGEKTTAHVPERLDLEAEIQRAAEVLPRGFIVSIHIEQGAGWIMIKDDHGEQLDWLLDSDRSLPQHFRDAVQHACDLGPLSEEESDG